MCCGRRESSTNQVCHSAQTHTHTTNVNTEHYFFFAAAVVLEICVPSEWQRMQTVFTLSPSSVQRQHPKNNSIPISLHKLHLVENDGDGQFNANDLMHNHYSKWKPHHAVVAVSALCQFISIFANSLSHTHTIEPKIRSSEYDEVRWAWAYPHKYTQPNRIKPSRIAWIFNLSVAETIVARIS